MNGAKYDNDVVEVLVATVAAEYVNWANVSRASGTRLRPNVTRPAYNRLKWSLENLAEVLAARGVDVGVADLKAIMRKCYSVRPELPSMEILARAMNKTLNVYANRLDRGNV